MGIIKLLKDKNTQHNTHLEILSLSLARNCIVLCQRVEFFKNAKNSTHFVRKSFIETNDAKNR
jgi:hypothetical protein